MPSSSQRGGGTTVLIIDRIMQIANEGASISRAVALALAELSPDEIATELARRLRESGNGRVRTAIDNHDPDQPDLFGGVHLPPFIPITVDGEQDFVPIEHVTNREELIDGLGWVVNRRAHQLRVAESHLEWALGSLDDWPAGMMLGEWRWRDVKCFYGDGGWRMNDPFERAHVHPVAGRTGHGETGWAHRSCNRRAGAT